MTTWLWLTWPNSRLEDARHLNEANVTGAWSSPPAAVEEHLISLPEKFTRQIYAQKCDIVYQHVSAPHHPCHLPDRHPSARRSWRISVANPPRQTPAACRLATIRTASR